MREDLGPFRVGANLELSPERDEDLPKLPRVSALAFSPSLRRMSCPAAGWARKRWRDGVYSAAME